jgi:cytochrome b
LNGEVRVWDPLSRIAHWALAVSVLIAWITSEVELEAAKRVHDWAGYAALAVVALRIVWGGVGPRHARFGEFVLSPSRTWSYARAVMARSEPRYLGHNPLGGWMVVALLAMAAAAGLSGWVSVTDRFWGVEWVQELHEALANALLLLIALHIAGVVFTSLRHRENLVRAMVSGRKRGPRPGDID